MKMLLPGERAGLRKGRQEGRHEMLREAVLDNLEARFKQVPYSVRERILDIKSEARLRRLHRETVVAENLDVFVAGLEGGK